jgi:glucosamine 6-phosphate synthetase-like amidotransferase/phosphosugar isomerase protein
MISWLIHVSSLLLVLLTASSLILCLGETKDVHRAVKLGEEKGVPCISVVNVVGSLIARATGLGVYLNAGTYVYSYMYMCIYVLMFE